MNQTFDFASVKEPNTLISLTLNSWVFLLLLLFKKYRGLQTKRVMTAVRLFHCSPEATLDLLFRDTASTLPQKIYLHKAREGEKARL